MLNDLLRFDNNELKNVKIRFNQNSYDDDRFAKYLSDPDIINNTAFLWRTSQRYFSVGQIAIALLRLSQDTWLLTTIKRITKELGVKDGVNYEGEEIGSFAPFFGRVIVKHKKSYQQQGRYAKDIIDEIEVLQILPNQLDGIDFPGYDRVRLSYEQLATIIHRRTKDWVSALENQKAVYLITDKGTGTQYVGSAYGDNGMLFSRWTNYVDNGHGGNKHLIALVDELGLGYVMQNFQYAILENYNARVDKNIILGRESWWKETLGSRAFGLNAN